MIAGGKLTRSASQPDQRRHPAGHFLALFEERVMDRNGYMLNATLKTTRSSRAREVPESESNWLRLIHKARRTRLALASPPASSRWPASGNAFYNATGVACGRYRCTANVLAVLGKVARGTHEQVCVRRCTTVDQALTELKTGVSNRRHRSA